MLEERRLQPKNMGLALSPSVSAKMVLVRTPLWQLFGLAPLLCEINGDQEAPATKTLFHFEFLLQGESSAIFLKAKKKPLELQRTSKGFFHGKNMAFFGRGDRFRTCGLVVPNHARYQLRHTSIRLLLSLTTMFILYCIFTASVNGISSVSPQFE